MLYGWGIKDALLMIALGIGYIVLYFAKREEKNFQLLGYIVGTVIIIYSIFCIFLNLIYAPTGIHKRTIMRYPQRMAPEQPYIPAPAK